MKTYRDVKGRFRKPTDDERWPDAADRVLVLSARKRFEQATTAMLYLREQERNDLRFLSGEQW